MKTVWIVETRDSGIDGVFTKQSDADAFLKTLHPNYPGEIEIQGYTVNEEYDPLTFERIGR